MVMVRPARLLVQEPCSGQTWQVLTQLQGDRTVLRVFNNVGRPVSGLVRLNCTVDAVVPAAAAAQQLKAQFTG
jgi:hypothetical protein